MGKFLTISQFSKATGISQQTLRSWDKRGKLVPHHVTEFGYRYYSLDQVQQYLGLQNRVSDYRVTVGYCRVLDKENEADMVYQYETIRDYMKVNGYMYEIVQEVGSGADLEREVFLNLMKRVMGGEIERIVVLSPNRLSSIGKSLIKMICDKYRVAFEVIETADEPFAEYMRDIEALVSIQTN